jgi:hypothetical protein
MIENLELIREHFPTWKTFVYIGNDVPIHIIERIQQFENTVIKYTNDTGANNMIHRFYAIDEPDVQRMVVRDADSRVHERDRWAIRRWIESGKGSHIIRDHRYHTTYIMGGVFGIQKGTLRFPVSRLFEHYRHRHRNQHGYDQFFLKDVIYPLIKENAIIFGEIRYPGENPEVIPFPIQNGEFIGQVVEYPNGIRTPTME